MTLNSTFTAEHILIERHSQYLVQADYIACVLEFLYEIGLL